MKVEREDKFSPITITIESLSELKWIFAIGNTGTDTAIKQAKEVGFELGKESHVEQMSLWNALSQYKVLVNE